MKALLGAGLIGWVLFLAGLALVISTGAGLADTLMDDHRSIGAGTVVGRYTADRCILPRRACQDVKGVRISVDRTGSVVKVPSEALYALNRRMRVELEEDHFNGRISRVHAEGRTYITYDTGKVGLFVIVPLLLVGLGIVAFTAPAIAGDVGRAVTGNGPKRQWAGAVMGSLSLLFLTVLTIVGVTEPTYEVNAAGDLVEVPPSLLPLFVVVPLAALAGAAVWLNAKALRAASPSSTPAA